MLTVNQVNPDPNPAQESLCNMNQSAMALRGVESSRDDFIMDEIVAGNNFGKMVKDLKHVLGKKGLTSKEIDVNKIREIMENYKSDESEWGKYAMHDPSRNYSRNGVVNINGNANLLILVWSQGKGSAIHDHANAHCCMKIIKGSLTESLYEMPHGEGKMTLKQETNLKCDQVGYISDDIGLHKMTNPSGEEVAVSLHLYTPPYASLNGCSIYDPKSGRSSHVDMSKYYSWQGKIVNTNNSSNC